MPAFGQTPQLEVLRLSPRIRIFVGDAASVALLPAPVIAAPRPRFPRWARHAAIGAVVVGVALAIALAFR